MQKRKLGSQGLEVSALGLGCMGMSWAYGAADKTESLGVLQRALELGINFWDTAEVYGPLKNEELLGEALKKTPRDKVIIATKFGFTWDEKNEINGTNSSPSHIRKSIDGSLKRLGTDYIDLYYQHRLDPKTPIEETIQVLAEFVGAGKIRYIGLSEVGPGTIRRAHAVYPISALQSEYSLWNRGVEEKILPTLRELNIGLVPYSPIGRGFLTGKILNLSSLDKNDFRQNLPRLQDENLAHNSILIEMIKTIAEKYHASPVQVALAWLLHQGNDIVPIPGTKHIRYLEENAKSTNLNFPEIAWDEITQFLSTFEVKGARYPEKSMKLLDNSD
ncbi:MAG TPA: aldo/keto reductase [Gammaproteobacteria bacterium]|nr:aldo/keto reductase [Gammaproteobacteria bacterium]